MSEIGLIDQWYQNWIPKGQCEADRSAKRVDILALQSAFYAAGVGVLLAGIILMGELIHVHQKRCDRHSDYIQKELTYVIQSRDSDSDYIMSIMN